MMEELGSVGTDPQSGCKTDGRRGTRQVDLSQSFLLSPTGLPSSLAFLGVYSPTTVHKVVRSMLLGSSPGCFLAHESD